MKTADKPAGAAAPTAEWATQSEHSNALALRLMAWVAITLGRPVARLLLHPITLYFMAFAPHAQRQSKRYLARALGRPATLGDRYRHVHAFASTVLDRIYFVRGQMQAFDLRVVGSEIGAATRAEGRGAFLLGAHIGSFESLHAIGEAVPGLRVAMVMYPENARLIHGALKALAPDFDLRIITIGRAGSTLAIRDWLAGGGVVGLLADRHLAADGGRAAAGAGTLEIPFLGVPTVFSDGPLRLAVLLRRRVLFMVGLYLGGNRYEVRFEELADFSTPITDPVERERQMHAALRTYVARLEALVREAPYNWFNFYDYWSEDVHA